MRCLGPLLCAFCLCLHFKRSSSGVPHVAGGVLRAHRADLLSAYGRRQYVRRLAVRPEVAELARGQPTRYNHPIGVWPPLVRIEGMVS